MSSRSSTIDLTEVLQKAEREKGLLADDVRVIFDFATSEDWHHIFDLARNLTQKQFCKKLYFFAPLYFSNWCINDCTYCGFRRSNRLIERRVLTNEEFLQEARFLWADGHRALLLIAGEHPVFSGMGQIVEYLCCLKRENLSFTVMIEIGPLDESEYHLLSELGVKQCLLFQETYNRNTYRQIHKGPKRNFEWRFPAMERALRAGMEKIGIGILLGLHPYREDLLELIRHAWSLKERFGIFPATISFPRLRSASGIPLFQGNGNTVLDEDYEKIIAVTRLALPSVGIVLTTRESPALRNRLLQLGIGVTHMSAGSSTSPGGYTLEKENEAAQFHLLDHRSFEEIEKKVCRLGYQPTFDFQN